MFSKGKRSSPPLDIHQPRLRRAPFIRAGLIVAALGSFAAAGALAVVMPGSPEPLIYQARSTLTLPADLTVLQTQDSQAYVTETRIRRGDTLAALLQRMNINEEGLLQFLTHDKQARSIYKLYPGRTLQAALDANGTLLWLRYKHTPYSEQADGGVARWLEVRPDGQDGFTAQELSDQAQTQVRVAQAEINSSLFGATDQAGIPDAITLQMADVLGSKIDFLKDLRKGDSFRVVYESYGHEGQEVGAGRLLAVEFVNQGTAHEAAWFEPENSSGGYYDFSGKSLKGAFLRTALKFSRISSTFGGRRHPVHGGWRNHNGVDYAAPNGTPIHATADGVVDFIGRQNGYGNTIILKHHGEFTTLYAHQSRFASGLRKGDRVEQGQLIGYVGATGWATGPHLHYEFRIAQKAVDPLSVNLPVARVLDAPQRKQFSAVLAAYQNSFELLQPAPEGVQLASR
ncbi:M23 family metallopeptidase [Alcaligenes sp. SDU_A2]|uniref:M23 family metallopeptidase n=1 Tax=Alcaligenes sp. SDU_A2 TaxID=3136634 RepID=UPI002B948AA1|nr:M23 family metallopeptidase [Alcaligenes sp.]HRL27212.1 M23 family metallopeptidase [Alcaligenes sp.]